MKILGAVPSAKIQGPLERVFAQAHGAGAPEGRAMIVQDVDGRWRHTLAGLNLEQRRRSIFVAEAEDAAALGLAVRLSVGGALRLPPSTAAASAALAAAQAATQRPLWCADPCVAAEMNGGGQTLRVSLRRPWLWRRLVGDRGALEALAALAVVLERPVLVQQGPVLDLTSVSTEEISRAWSTLED
ncbi:MAG: hypothetical protein K8R59_12930, partial [Thermoanaerobaculales bacterium]|nr:hypothetical protein [Thermoanaerobaculales bacterium]